MLGRYWVLGRTQLGRALQLRISNIAVSHYMCLLHRHFITPPTMEAFSEASILPSFHSQEKFSWSIRLFPLHMLNINLCTFKSKFYFNITGLSAQPEEHLLPIVKYHDIIIWQIVLYRKIMIWQSIYYLHVYLYDIKLSCVFVTKTHNWEACVSLTWQKSEHFSDTVK